MKRMYFIMVLVLMSCSTKKGVEFLNDRSLKPDNVPQCKNGNTSHPESFPYQMETNSSLSDDVKYGELFLLDPKTPRDPSESLRYIPVLERQKLGTLIDFTYKVTLVPVRESSTVFVFDDPEVMTIPHIFDQLHSVKWFRVEKLEAKNGKFIIRGFNEKGRLVYYHEWCNQLSQVLSDDRPIRIPKFKGGNLELDEL